MSKQDYERQVRLRLETQTVTAYLKALTEGTLISKDDAFKKMEEAQQRLEQARDEKDYLQVLELTQKRAEIAESLEHADLEAEFVKVAASFGERKGIRYTTWREVGVPAKVLREAGISR